MKAQFYFLIAVLCFFFSTNASAFEFEWPNGEKPMLPATSLVPIGNKHVDCVWDSYDISDNGVNFNYILDMASTDFVLTSPQDVLWHIYYFYYMVDQIDDMLTDCADQGMSVFTVNFIFNDGTTKNICIPLSNYHNLIYSMLEEEGCPSMIYIQDGEENEMQKELSIANAKLPQNITFGSHEIVLNYLDFKGLVCRAYCSMANVKKEDLLSNEINMSGDSLREFVCFITESMSIDDLREYVRYGCGWQYIIQCGDGTTAYLNVTNPELRKFLSEK